MKLLLPALLLASAALTPASASVTRADWGKTADGQPVSLYTLSDSQVTVKITTYGARIVSLETPDRTGKMGDVVLGYDNVTAYEADPHTFFGATVGRYANRIANGRFSLDGHDYTMPQNDGPNGLHGGPVGFDKKNWAGRILPDGVEFSLVSPDGDQGFPGKLNVHVRFHLRGESLRIDYEATTTKDTILNMTNHNYYNLSGDPQGDILSEELQIDASHYTPVNATLIPTGQLAPVAGTPFDFRKPMAIGSRIGADDPQLKLGKGYDHNFAFDPNSKGLRPRVHVYDPASGRTLTVSTTEPGVQLYSGNYLDGTLKGKGGIAYPVHAAYALETQHYPDSPNEPSFPSTELRAGQTYHSTTVLTFGSR